MRAPDTVNVAEVESPKASFAWTIFAPDTDVGTVNVAVKIPEASEVILDGVVARVAPLYVIEIGDKGANVEPEIVTVPPTIPLAGNSVIDEVREFTICARGVAVLSLGPKLESPEYVAVIGFDPISREDVEYVAVPAKVSGTGLPTSSPFTLNCTVPVGVPAAGETGLT